MFKKIGENMHDQPENLKGIWHWSHVALHVMNDVVVMFQSTIDRHHHVLPSSLQDITSMFIEGRFYKTFCQNFIGIEFLYEKIYEISSIENLIAKTDFYYQFRMCIFKTNFFGIRLIICSIVSSFLFWRYLRLFPFVDYITNISRVIFF